MLPSTALHQLQQPGLLNSSSAVIPTESSKTILPVTNDRYTQTDTVSESAKASMGMSSSSNSFKGYVSPPPLKDNWTKAQKASMSSSASNVRPAVSDDSDHNQAPFQTVPNDFDWCTPGEQPEFPPRTIIGRLPPRPSEIKVGYKELMSASEQTTSARPVAVDPGPVREVVECTLAPEATSVLNDCPVADPEPAKAPFEQMPDDFDWTSPPVPIANNFPNASKPTSFERIPDDFEWDAPGETWAPRFSLQQPLFVKRKKPKKKRTNTS